MWLVLLLIGILSFLFICFVVYEGKKEERRHQKAEKEYLEKNSIPYEINQVVPNLLYLVSLRRPIPRDLVSWPFLKQGIKELQKKFELIFVKHQFSHENTKEVESSINMLGVLSPVYLVFVLPKKNDNTVPTNVSDKNQPLYQITSIIPGALFHVSLRQRIPDDKPATPILDEGVKTLKEKFEVIHVSYQSGEKEFGNAFAYFVFTKGKKK